MKGFDFLAPLIIWGLISLLYGLAQRRSTPPGPSRSPQDRQTGARRTEWPVREPWQRLGERLERELRSRDPRQVMRKYQEWDRAREGAAPSAAATPPDAGTGPGVLQPTIIGPAAKKPLGGEYLGSMGYSSSEGTTLEGPAPDSMSPEGRAATPSQSTGVPPGSPAVAQALAMLRSPAYPGASAATAVVLSEILGQPRALRPRRRVMPSGRRRCVRE